MTDTERTLSALALTLTMGSIAMYLGIKILKHKPIVVPPKTQRIGILLIILVPLSIGSVPAFIRTILFTEPIIDVAKTVGQIGVIVALNLLPLFAITLWFILFNVTGTMLIQELETVLQHHALKYEIRETTNILSMVTQIAQVTIVLTQIKAVIKITFAKEGMAWMRIGRKYRFTSSAAVLGDLARALSEYECDASESFAMRLFLISALCLVASIVVLILP